MSALDKRLRCRLTATTTALTELRLRWMGSYEEIRNPAPQVRKRSLRNASADYFTHMLMTCLALRNGSMRYLNCGATCGANHSTLVTVRSSDTTSITNLWTTIPQPANTPYLVYLIYTNDHVGYLNISYSSQTHDHLCKAPCILLTLTFWQKPIRKATNTDDEASGDHTRFLHLVVDTVRGHSGLRNIRQAKRRVLHLSTERKLSGMVLFSMSWSDR